MKATFLQIDLQNLFLEAKKRKYRLDFEKIWQHFNSRESEFLTEAYVYLTRGDFENSKFETKIISIGYKIRAKNLIKVLYKNQFIYKKIKHNVTITIDSLDKIDAYNKLILMSGDGDFIDLCKYLRGKKKEVEIWSFKECYNPSFEGFADKIYFINENFFYEKPKVKVFGFNWGI